MSFPTESYTTPDQVEGRLFCLEQIVNFSDDDYAYFDALMDTGQYVTIVYNYPPANAPVIAAMEKSTPIHAMMFDEGIPSVQKNGVCPCQRSEHVSK